MKNPIKLALILIVLTGGGLAAQRQFITAKPGRKAFDAAYNKALNAHMTSKFREAEISYQAALKEAAKLPGAYGYGRTLSLLAIAYHIHGAQQWAEKFYLEGLDYNRKNNPDTIPMEAAGLGLLYLQQGKLGKARPLLEEGLRAAQEDDKKGDEDYCTADSLSVLAEFYEKKGELKTAGDLYTKAVAIFKNKETAFPFKILTAELMNSYPIILYKTGEFYRRAGDMKTAKYFYARALRAWSNWTDLDSRPSLKARVLDYKGRTLKALGQSAEAAEDLKTALRLYKTLYQPTDPRIAEAGAQLAELKK